MKPQNRMFPIVRDGNRSLQKIQCSQCPTTDQNVLSTNAAGGDDQLVAYFRRRGWVVDVKRGKHMCAACLSTATEAHRIEKAHKMEKKLAVVQSAPSPNSILAKKILSDLLFENYDATARDYKPGWDDARIAKECGLSEAFVTERRASDYGPCSPPRAVVINEITGMAEKIALMAKDVADVAKGLESKAKALIDETARLEAVMKQNAKKVA